MGLGDHVLSTSVATAMPSADDVVVGVAFLLAAGLGVAAGRVLWHHSRVLAVVSGTATFALSLIPVGVLVLVFCFQVLGIDLLD